MLGNKTQMCNSFIVYNARLNKSNVTTIIITVLCTMGAAETTMLEEVGFG